MDVSYATIAMFATPVLAVASGFLGVKYQALKNFATTFHSMIKDGQITAAELKEVEQTKVVQEIKSLVKKIKG